MFITHSAIFIVDNENGNHHKWEIHFMITFYVFTPRDVSAAQISHAMMSRKMKRTFFLAFPVRVSRTIHPSFILHFIRASFRRSTSLRRGNS